jgi:hypothetical protein
LTRGRAATPAPFDLGAVAGTDELVEALSTRRLADLPPGPAGDEDPAATLLAALVTEVDAGAPPLPAPARVACGMPGTRRRGVRAIVAFGVAGLVLTSAGAAAAGGGGDVSALRTPHGPAQIRATERSNENAERHAPRPVLVDHRTLDDAGDRDHVVPPTPNEPGHALNDSANRFGGRHWSRSKSRPPTEIHPPPPLPGPGSPSPEPSQTPTPSPDSVSTTP